MRYATVVCFRFLFIFSMRVIDSHLVFQAWFQFESGIVKIQLNKDLNIFDIEKVE